MASILPLTLATIAEGENVDVTFSAVLEVGETLVDINITDHRANTGITVTGARYHGQYQDSFDLGPSGLKYRDTRDNTYHTVGKFSDLPANPAHGHVYRFEAPSPLSTDYFYEVTVNYTYEDPLVPGVIDELQIVQTFTQTVKGKWDNWATQLRNYIAAGST
ncbi:hypothetical protein VPFG_00390 [Vibrio phage nt-1]|uniref:Uncharacterized protein n=1 Tax=Vibrio phage nt-1 TaxID=115992 RepID=R9TJV5_9CAUD|nr:hypothetical protein VPFG_00390 [Vibrio phage nt-1]AGN30387.1 hypothetical protein VPFG_00390 [Vibrio phage nt-1]